MKILRFCIAAALTVSLLSPAFSDAPPRYRVTVWTIRPTVKRMPKSAELDGGLWAIKAPGASQIPIGSDAGLLASLRHANPLYDFPRFEHRQVSEIPAERWFTANVPKGCRLRIRVRVRDRAKLIADVLPPKGSTERKSEQYFFANRMAVEVDWHSEHHSLSSKIENVPIPPNPMDRLGEKVFGAGHVKQRSEKEVTFGGSGGSEGGRGMIFMLPATGWMTGETIDFDVHYNPQSRRADRRGRIVYQRPTDIIFYRIEEIK